MLKVIELKKSDWPVSYLALITEMRKKANNNFKKDFSTLLNNAVFGMLLYILFLNFFTYIFL